MDNTSSLFDGELTYTYTWQSTIADTEQATGEPLAGLVIKAAGVDLNDMVNDLPSDADSVAIADTNGNVNLECATNGLCDYVANHLERPTYQDWTMDLEYLGGVNDVFTLTDVSPKFNLTCDDPKLTYPNCNSPGAAGASPMLVLVALATIAISFFTTFF